MTSVSPGSTVTLEVRTEPNSDVALLAVDSGMYALNNKNKLTREQARLPMSYLYCYIH